MKYANFMISQGTSSINLGDMIQIEAIEYLYSVMGIHDDEIIRISTDQINTYKGETVILPINYPLYGIYDISSHIKPVYLGVSMLDGVATKGLRMFGNEPIGCRDGLTYDILKKEKIPAYYGGCLTITFPRRQKEPLNGVTYIVGVSDAIYERIPRDIVRDAKRKEHIYFCKNEKEIISAKEVLDEYKNNAKLVITSKIHCAQPCIAMGIPVVFLCDEISFRYDVIKNYLPIYDVANINKGSVDWNPQIVELDNLKETMLQNAIERIKFARKGFNCSEYVSNGGLTEREKSIDKFFSNNNRDYSYKIDMLSFMQSYIKKKYREEDCFLYAIWGINQYAHRLEKWIKKNYPNAVLDKVVDRNKKMVLGNQSPCDIEELRNYPHIVFVTATTVIGIVKELFEDYHIINYVACHNGLKIEDGEQV